MQRSESIPQQRFGPKYFRFRGVSIVGSSWNPSTLIVPSLPPRLDTVEIQTRSINLFYTPILALPLSSPYLSNCELSPPPRRGANVTRTFKRINGIQRRNRSYIFETIFVSSFFKKKISLTPRVPFASGDLIDRGCSCAFHEDRRCENRREPIFNRLPTSLSIPFRKEGS